MWRLRSVFPLSNCFKQCTDTQVLPDIYRHPQIEWLIDWLIATCMTIFSALQQARCNCVCVCVCVRWELMKTEIPLQYSLSTTSTSTFRDLELLGLLGLLASTHCLPSHWCGFQIQPLSKHGHWPAVQSVTLVSPLNCSVWNCSVWKLLNCSVWKLLNCSVC